MQYELFSFAPIVIGLQSLWVTSPDKYQRTGRVICKSFPEPISLCFGFFHWNQLFIPVSLCFSCLVDVRFEYSENCVDLREMPWGAGLPSIWGQAAQNMEVMDRGMLLQGRLSLISCDTRTHRFDAHLDPRLLNY